MFYSAGCVLKKKDMLTLAVTYIHHFLTLKSLGAGANQAFMCISKR